MKLRRKIIFTSFFLYVFLIASLLILLFVSLRSAREVLLTEHSDLIEELEFERLEHDISDQAGILDNALDRYYDDILILQERFISRYESKEMNSSLIDAQLYVQNDAFGFPAYGYVHPEYGAFADFDLLGTAGPWLPKRLVDRALQDEQAKEEIINSLDILVSMTSIFQPVYKKNERKLMLDLIWIVLDSGASNVYPPYDWLAIIAENPDVIDLDESEKDYVRLLNPENNPERKILWLDPYFDEYRLEWMTSVVAPLYSDNIFQGTVGEDVLLSQITNSVAELQSNDFGYKILIDANNHAIVFPEQAIADFTISDNAKVALQEMLKPAETQEWSEEMLLELEKPMQEIAGEEFIMILENVSKSQSGVFVVEINEEKRIVSFSKMVDTGWLLVRILPYDEVIIASTDYELIVSQLMFDIRSNYWVFIIFGFIFVSIISLLRYFEVIRPIMILTKHVENPDDKEFCSKLECEKLIKRDDEIGVLANAFRTTLDKLKIAIKTIDTANKELEDRVRARTEDLNQANKKLLELDRMKDEFLNVSSHELKTPLIPIKAQLQLLLAGDYGELRPDQKKSLEMILRNEERLNTLASDVMDISKIQSKKLKLEKEQVNLDKIIKDEVEQFVPVAKDKDLSIVFEDKTGQPIEVVVDIRRIQQVISNLISNAIKFTPELGKISVILDKDKDNAIIKVVDTGIGIDQEDIEHIFEPFFQVESGLIRKFGGTGLGLSICKGIVEAHGGKIWVESEGAGMGTTFSFTLPLSH